MAFHEAGHVVAEVELCKSFPDSACISDDASLDHAGRTAGRSFLGVMDEALVDNADERFRKMIEARRRRYAAVVLAGPLAEYLALELPIDVSDLTAEWVGEWAEDGEVSTDMEKVRELVEGLRPGHAEQFVEEAVESAIAALSARWTDVQAVATALVERRSLDREALWDMLL